MAYKDCALYRFISSIRSIPDYQGVTDLVASRLDAFKYPTAGRPRLLLPLVCLSPDRSRSRFDSGALWRQWHLRLALGAYRPNREL